jgi:hypothetical protein
MPPTRPGRYLPYSGPIHRHPLATVAHRSQPPKVTRKWHEARSSSFRRRQVRPTRSGRSGEQPSRGGIVGGEARRPRWSSTCQERSTISHGVVPAGCSSPSRRTRGVVRRSTEWFVCQPCRPLRTEPSVVDVVVSPHQPDLNQPVRGPRRDGRRAVTGRPAARRPRRGPPPATDPPDRPGLGQPPARPDGPRGPSVPTGRRLTS